MLAIHVNRVVSIEQLIDAVWPENPPSTARRQVQICVSAIRKACTEAGVPDAIVTRPPGYQCMLDPTQVDSEQFVSLLADARRVVEQGRAAAAADILRTALALWRGPALAGITAEPVQRAARTLSEQAELAIELRVDLDLSLGRHREVQVELDELVASQPLREHRYGQLMLALYRSGRQAEALATYRRAYTVLVNELGVEPGPELTALEQAILARDPDLLVTASAPTPKPGAAAPADPDHAPDLLPADLLDFAGRTRELHEAYSIVTHRNMRSLVVSGRAGAGKSAFAIRLARELADTFPDGRLYADFRISGGVDHALLRFLRALGVPETRVPGDRTARLDMYRSKLVGTRTLIVLDDVESEADTEQFRVPDSECLLIVTCRRRLGGLPGAQHIGIDGFDDDAAIQLLSGMIGSERVAAEHDAARELVQLCAGLPLAVRLASARLTARPHWRLDRLVQRLRSPSGRLDELTYGDASVRASLRRSYDRLGSAEQRLFRWCALLHTGDHPAWVAAALLDTSIDDAEDLLERLVDVHLVDAVQSTVDFGPRYRLHELTRIYAQEKLVQIDPPTEQHDALQRVLGGWLALAETAYRREYGGDYAIIHGTAPRWRPPDADADAVGTPRLWWQHERQSLVAAVRQAADANLDELCWDLTLTIIVPVLEAQNLLPDWLEVSQAALTSSTTTANTRGMAAALFSFGALHAAQAEVSEAQRYFTQSAALFTECGDVRGRALAQCHLASVHRVRGNDTAMLDSHHEALEAFRALNDPVGIAYVLSELAKYHVREGATGLAREMLAEAESICADARHPRLNAHVSSVIGKLHLDVGDLARSRSAFRRALHIARENNDRSREACCLHGIGRIEAAEGQPELAAITLTTALRLAKEVGEQLREAQVLQELAKLAVRQSRTAVAVDHLTRAARIANTIDAPLWIARIQIMLADVHRRTGDTHAADTAVSRAEQALANIDSQESRKLRASLQTSSTLTDR